MEKKEEMKSGRKTEAVSSNPLSVSNRIPYLFSIVGVISSPFFSLLFAFPLSQINSIEPLLH